MQIKILPHLISANIKSTVAQKWSFILRLSMMFVNNFIFFITWWVLFQRVDHLGSWGLKEVAFLFGVSAVGFGLGYGFFAGFTRIPELVRSGGLDPYLTKPGGVLLRVLVSRSEASAWGDLLSGLLLIYLSGYCRLEHLAVVLLSGVCAAGVFTAMGIIFFSLAFWLDNIDDVSFRLWELLITFSSYPESIFPEAARFFLYTVIPAAFISFLPVALVQNFSWGTAVYLCGGTATSVCLSAYIFHRGLFRYESGNRWSLHGV